MKKGEKSEMKPIPRQTPIENKCKTKIKTLLRLRVLFNVFFKSFFNYLAKLTLTSKLLNNENLEVSPEILANVNSGFYFSFLLFFTHKLHHKTTITLKLKNTSPFNRQIYKLEHPNSITVRR